MKIEKLIKKSSIKINSKDIQKGDIFVCALGNYDKNPYIKEAINNGAKLIITNKDVQQKTKYIKVNNPNAYLEKLLKIKYDNPLEKMHLIGVTGTDGKTTTATLIRYMLNCASIGTNGVEYYNKKISINNTTPNIIDLYYYFNIFNQNNIHDIVMEVSSESYLTNRIPNLKFDIGIFLNISNEHLDKHYDFENYLECKKELLKNSKIKIINRDSKYYFDIIKNLDNYLTFGEKKSNLQILKYRLSFNKTTIWIKYLNKKYKIISPLLGRGNIDSLCASILSLLALGYEINEVIERISLIKVIPGRMEKITNNIMIDYAHTEESILNILKFLYIYCRKKIVVVLGCAGHRYKEKRKKIGKYALKYAYITIFTSDDPRKENSSNIIEEMINKKKGNYYVIPNREIAINFALVFSKQFLVLILGKGRDNYMAIGDKKMFFSDIAIIENFLRNINNPINY